MILEEPNMNEPEETILITGTIGRLGLPGSEASGGNLQRGGF